MHESRKRQQAQDVRHSQIQDQTQGEVELLEVPQYDCNDGCVSSHAQEKAQAEQTTADLVPGDPLSEVRSRGITETGHCSQETHLGCAVVFTGGVQLLKSSSLAGAVWLYECTRLRYHLKPESERERVPHSVCSVT